METLLSISSNWMLDLNGRKTHLEWEESHLQTPNICKLLASEVQSVVTFPLFQCIGRSK